jgi:3-oxoacyl-[acyl-carrier protein] reductase
MDFGLQGRAAVVAAASRGLGFASALELAREGCDVAISGRTPGSLREAAGAIAAETGRRVEPVAGDVALRADCEALVQRAVSTFGRLDVLVANTGGPAPGSFDQLDDARWRSSIDATLFSVKWLIEAALPHMTRAGWGRIVIIASTSAVQPIPGLVLSNILRPGLVGMTKSLADELAPRGVTINCVLPGSHDTDRIRHVAAARAQREGVSPDEATARMASSIPVGRFGRPEELAAAVAFLASQRAAYITGTSLVVDGGMTRAIS